MTRLHTRMCAHAFLRNLDVYQNVHATVHIYNVVMVAKGTWVWLASLRTSIHTHAWMIIQIFWCLLKRLNIAVSARCRLNGRSAHKHARAHAYQNS